MSAHAVIECFCEGVALSWDEAALELARPLALGPVSLWIGYDVEQGCRTAMEDYLALRVVLSSGGEAEEVLVGVFDGHYGGGAAALASRHFFSHLESEPLATS